MSSQDVTFIKADDLLGIAEKCKFAGCRFIQVCCTRVPAGFEMTYTFDKDFVLKNFRFTVTEEEPVTSITSLYLPAFVSENEIHDLFGVHIVHIASAVDYHGKFFRLAKKTPWHDLPKGGAQ